MNIGRTSTFSTAASRIITAILLAGFIPDVAACSRDPYGFEYEYCYRIIAGSISFAIFFSLAILVCVARRRRIAQENRAPIQQAPQTEAPQTANVNQGPYHVPLQDVPPPQGIPPQDFPSPQVAPQYPPQVSDAVASPYKASVSQPAALLPQYVAPSPGVAPTKV